MNIGKPIDEDFSPIELHKGMCVEDIYYWEYRLYPRETDTEKRGFYLTRKPIWNIITANAYVVEIGKDTALIPASHYVVIGDLDGGLDFIKLDEIVGRPFEAFTVSNKLDSDSWMLKDLRVVGYQKICRIPYPDTKGIVPVCIGQRTILLSTVDLYNKIGDYAFSDFG